VWLPDEFHFLRPLFLLGIPLALVLGWRLARRANARSGWHTVIDGSLQSAMIETVPMARSRALSIATAVAFALASLVLAGPTWQRLPQPVEQRSDALVLVLDLSLSMYAADLSPSRLTLARHKIVDLLRQRREGFTALVVYAGDAHVVVPLTDDVATIENLLGSLVPEMMPTLGSDVSHALELALGLVDSAGAQQASILLVTDGIDAIADVSEHCRRSLPVSILGVGTPAGAPIPLAFMEQGERYLTDRAGARVVARLDDARLEAAAGQCGGRYARITVGGSDLATLLADPLTVGSDDTKLERTFDLWDDAGQYAVLLLAPFALLSFRRGAVAVLALCFVQPADAGLWEDLWWRADQQGVMALREGDPDRALTHFKDPQWTGVAHYRSGAYESAEQRFREDDSARGHYNRGNALAREERYEDAMAAYDAALERAPGDEDARFNRELVANLLEEQRQDEGSPKDGRAGPNDRNEPPSPPQRSDAGDEQKEGDESADSRPEPGDDAHDDTSGDSTARKQQEEEQASTELPRDEQQDALERWLRRVPDDPGGLLRRKFQYETNQRLRRGDYPDRGERIW
jgi:Ca-activated chloride channel family protein